jgi:carboxylesterase
MQYMTRIANLPVPIETCAGDPRGRRAVLALHGLCSSALEIRNFAQSLRDRGFHVEVPVLDGYSALPSGGIVQPSLFESWIGQAVVRLDRLAHEYEWVALAGLSMGATLALAIAAERPDPVRALALLSTTLFFDGWNVSRWRFLLPLAYYTPLGRLYRYRETPPYGVRNLRVRDWIAGQIRDGALSAAGASTIPTPSLREADRLVRHVQRTLPRVVAPTLLVHAREDDVASLRNVRCVRSRIGTGEVEEVILDDSYHMITLDNERDKVSAKAAAFFESRHAQHVRLDAAA